MTDLLDITVYDKVDKTRVQYYLSKNSFINPFLTFHQLAVNPSKFRDSNETYFKISLTESQNSRLINYLNNRDYYLNGFGSLEDATHLLAFSFGEKPDVNNELASIVLKSIKTKSDIQVTVQWEIADIIKETNPELAGQIDSISLDKGQTYINTDQVIDKFIAEVLIQAPDLSQVSLLVVAQAWHAPRCVQRCKEKGLNVVAGRFSERFSPDDPQPWVRNAFSWVLKEGTK